MELKHTAKRLLSLTLAIIMVIGLLPTSALAASGDYRWEGNNLEFQNAVSQVGVTSVSSHYGNPAYIRVYEGETIVCNVTDKRSFTPKENVTYAVKTRSLFGSSWKDAASFTVIIYDVLTVNTTKDGITTTSTQDIYRGESGTIAVNEYDGYNVTISGDVSGTAAGEYTISGLTSDKTVNVVYLADTQSTITVADSADSTVTVPGTADASSDVTVTVTPKDNRYVAAVKLTSGGNDVKWTSQSYANGVWTGKFKTAAAKTAYSIDVDTAEILTSNATQLSYYKAMSAEDITEACFNLLSDVSKLIVGSATNISVMYYKNNMSPWPDEWVDLTDLSKFGTNWSGGFVGTENIRISYNGNGEKYGAGTLEKSVTLVEGRQPAEITYINPSTEDEPLVFESASEIETAIRNATTTNSTGNLSIALKEGTLPTAGKDAELTYTITVVGTDYHLENSIDVVIYVRAKSNPADIIINIVGNGTVSVGDLSANGTLTTGNYNIIATPGTAAGYVESVKVNDDEIGDDINKYADGKFTDSVSIANDNTYTITVTFAERSITTADNGTIDYNFYYKVDDKVADLKEELLSKIVTATNGGTLTADKLTVYVYNNSLNVWYKIGAEGWEGLGNLANETFNAAVEDLRLVWAEEGKYPQVSVDVTVNVHEIRPTVSFSVAANATDFDTVEQIDNFAAGIVTAKYGTSDVPADAIKIERITAAENIDLTKDGQEQSVAYKATINSTANYIGGTRDFAVVATGIVHDSIVNVVENLPDNGEATVSVTDGTAIVTAKPADGGYYVDSITAVCVTENVDGQQDVEVSTVSYNNLTGTATFQVEGSDYGAVKTYTATVNYAQRQIVENSHKGKITYDVTKSPEDRFELVRTTIYNAVVKSSVPEIEDAIKLDDVTIFIKNSEGQFVELTDCSEFHETDKTETVKLVWKATAKYPEVSTDEITLEVDVELSAATITVPETLSALEVDGLPTNEAVKEYLLASGLNVSANASEPTFEVVAGQEAPDQGAEETINVLVSVAGNDYFLAAEKTVAVPVVGKVHPATVTITTVGDDAATVTVSHKRGEETVNVTSGGKYLSGVLTIVAAPTGSNYVEKIEVFTDGSQTGTVLADVNYNNTVCTASCDIADGWGSAYNAEGKTYEIKVTFAEYKLPLNDTIAQVAFNPKADVNNEFVSEMENAVKAAILRERVSEASVKFYISRFSGYFDFDSGVLNSNFLLGFGTAIKEGATTDTEMIQISLPATNKYPAISQDGIVVTLVDPRAPAVVELVELGVVPFDTTEEIDAAFKAALKAHYGTEKTPISADLIKVTLPDPHAKTDAASDGTVQNLTYKVSISGTDTYAGVKDQVFTIQAQGKIHLSTVNVGTVTNGTLTVSGLKAGENKNVQPGAYTVTVTPAASAESHVGHYVNPSSSTARRFPRRISLGAMTVLPPSR